MIYVLSIRYVKIRPVTLNQLHKKLYSVFKLAQDCAGFLCQPEFCCSLLSDKF
jgi:hypothetical protein